MRAFLSGLLAVVIMGLYSSLSAQVLRPAFQDLSMVPPMHLDVSLAGNFGELRTNHFHAGLDIRTQGTTGHPVMSVAEGYVERIKISAWGYGNVLYVKHPNGLSSTYAHLSRFNEDIEAFVRNIQYEQRRFAVQVFPGPAQLPVEQGDTIAYSGNSGSSGGPHLHFELRSSRSGVPLNPLLFDFLPIEDDRRPRPRYIKLYPLDDNSFIEARYPSGKTYYRTETPLKLRLSGDGIQYGISGNPRLRAAGKIGFAVEAYDYHNGSGFRLGIYQMRMLHNGRELYHHRMDRVSFLETRYINAHMDYREKTLFNNKFMKTFREPGNQLSIYENYVERGIVELASADTHSVQFVLEDEHRNRATIELNLQASPQEAYSEATMGPQVARYLPHDAPSTFVDEDIRLRFRSNTFYERIPFTFRKEDTLYRKFSPTYVVHDPLVPVHRRYTLSLDVSGVPERYRHKAVVVRRDHHKRRRSEGGTVQGEWITARPRYFGAFFVDVDTLSPRVTPINIYNGANMRRKSAILVRISDNLSGIADFDAYIDGEWALMEYDGKNALLSYEFPDDFPSGTHSFRLVVSDGRGNSSRMEVTFRR
jgi:hypothetical protein